MNNFEILILALALVFNSWNSYVNAGIALTKEPLVRKVYYLGITFLAQFSMAGSGIWIGFKVSSFEAKTNIIISLSIMLIVGIRILFWGIRQQPQEKTIEYTDNSVTLFAALAEGITPLFIGFAIGILSLHPYLHWLLIGLFLFMGIIAGLVVSMRTGISSLKIRLDYIGGFLFIAAAIKLALNITQF